MNGSDENLRFAPYGGEAHEATVRALERRAAARSVPLLSRSLIGWWDRDEFVAIEGRLRDISRAGIALETLQEPPQDREVAFCLTPGLERECVKGEVVAVEGLPSDKLLVRIAFWEPCPFSLYRTAVHGSPDLTFPSLVSPE